MILRPEDMKTPTWKRLKKQLAEDMEGLRITLESPLSEERTASTRGEIKRIRYLLALDEALAPASEADEDA